METYLLISQVLRLAERLCVDDGACAELKSLEPLVCICNVLAHKHYAVVFHNDRLKLRIALKLFRNLLAEAFAARNVIGGKTYGTADALCLRDDVGVRHLVHYAEGHESRRMGVDN